jgi:hypothetical protein
MRLLRSWPSMVPPGRAYVHDDMPRLLMERCDYRVLADVDDDVLLIEWDIAVERDDLTAFAARAGESPKRVLVAPYRLYDEFDGRMSWTHRRYLGDPDKPNCYTRTVRVGEQTCHLFGLGMAYLPRALVVAYLAAWPDEHFSDGGFSGWHFRNADDPEVPIMWDVRPVHLHYQLADTGLTDDPNRRGTSGYHG